MTRSRKPGVGDKDSNIYAAFTAHRSALKRFIARFLSSDADIEDVSQEAFLKAFHAEQQKSIVKPRSFLFRIAKNLALKELSKKSHQITDLVEDFDDMDVISRSNVDSDVNDVENEMQAREELGVFCEAVASLPEQCRRVFLMRKVYGLSHKEIASRLEIAVSTVEKHLARGLKECSAYMREQSGTTDAESGGTHRAMVAGSRGKAPVNEKA